MNYDDLKRMELHDHFIRQNAFKDCATHISQVVDYHLAAHPGFGIQQMNKEQLLELIDDMMLLTDQIRIYGETLPDEYE